eukprot:scaffold4767_cov80-Skeletonema_dohrnii-CCMP3373.AAC.2
MQQQQQSLLAAAPSKKEEASPWWDFFNHCKEAADSSDSEDDCPQQNDDISYADYNDMCATGPTDSANYDDLIIKQQPTPLSPASIVRTTPVKLISARSDNNGDGESDSEAARPDTPGTQDSSFETSFSSSSIPDDDDYDEHHVFEVSSFQSIEVDKGEIEEMEGEEMIKGDEESDFIDEITPPGSLLSSSHESSSPLKVITTTSVVMSPPPKDAAQYIKHQQQQPLKLLQSISEEDSDDEDNFIGNIEVMPISPFLSSQQRNIRKNAYDLLKRLGGENSLSDLNSAEVEREEEEEDNCEQQQQKQQQQLEVQEEVDSLKRQLGECTDMIVQLHDSLRSYSNDATNDVDVTSVGVNNDDDNKDDDGMAELQAEIAELKSQLESKTLQTSQDADQILSLEAQLQQALQESSHHVDKLHEYEESIGSLNEAVVRSHLYNEEIVKELMVSRKENDDLTMRLLDNHKDSEEDEEEDKNELLSLEGDVNASSSITTTSVTDKVTEASLGRSVVDVIDDASTVTTAAPDAPAGLTMTCGQVPSVFHHRQQPLSALQDHLLSCIKLPLRVLSILFSVWVTIIILRIVLIFSLMLVDNKSFLEDDGFNTPGIY